MTLSKRPASQRSKFCEPAEHRPALYLLRLQSPPPEKYGALRGGVRGGVSHQKEKMLLTDVAVEHVLVSKTTGARQAYVLHPFTDTQRDTLGKFELVRDVQEPGRKAARRSTYVSFAQLAELVAKGVLDEFNVYVRMCPAQVKYPGANPVKKLLPSCIRAGSPFDVAIQSVDVSKPASRELRTALLRINIKL